jgi:hypothetical protein
MIDHQQGDPGRDPTTFTSCPPVKDSGGSTIASARAP